MTTDIGHVEAIFRYPVKSMAGERLDVADLGWHGIDGDRRLAFRRTQERNDFPWLTASKLPDLLLFTPLRHEDDGKGNLPTHVRTPEGKEMAVFGEELAVEIERRHRAPVHMTHKRTLRPHWRETRNGWKPSISCPQSPRRSVGTLRD